MRVNLRIFLFIMATYVPPDTLMTSPREPTRNVRHARRDCCFPECSLSIEGGMCCDPRAFWTGSIEFFLLIENLLGILSGFCYGMSKTPCKPFLLEDYSCRLSVWTSEEQGVMQRIEQLCPQQQLEALARQTGAVQRQRKIKPMSLLRAFCLLTLHGPCSLSMAAIFTGILNGCVLSKQALSKRINGAWVLFFSKILGCTVARTALSKEAQAKGIFSLFNRVLVTDSTKLSLPKKLASFFPGSCNQSKKQNAMISLQTTLDLLSETFVDFLVAPFTYNDQRAAPDILKIIVAGDLIIRDLGYFVPQVFRSIIDRSAYFLSRYHLKTDLLDAKGNKIDLLPLLKKTPLFDTWLYLGKEARILVRLVAIPVPDKVANERRRKLLKNKNRDRRLNPGKEQLALCGWEIFVTNVHDVAWTCQDVSNAYGLRWRIEIIFKAWKSHFNITEFTNGSKEYVQILVYVRLIFITLFQVTFVRFDKWIDQTAPGTHLSLLKFAQFFRLFLILALGSAIVNSEILMSQILRHCVYEKRTKRLSQADFMQILQS